MDSRYAPIVVFGYKRKDKLKSLLADLERNPDVEKMRLYICIDVPVETDAQGLIISEDVIAFAKDYVSNSKFMEVTLDVAQTHRGLANSIITSVSRIINEFGRIIVFEDDLRTSNDVLAYFNEALDFYENDKRIFSISGHGKEFAAVDTIEDDVYLLGMANSWGWASWADRWNEIDWEVQNYQDFKNNRKQKKAFNNRAWFLSESLKRQMEEDDYDSWAIRWNFHSFLRDSYTVYPKRGYIKTLGRDEVDTHRSINEDIQLVDDKKIRFVDLNINHKITKSFYKSTQPSLYRRIKSLIWRTFFEKKKH